MVDSFHELLVHGTATYALGLFQAAPPLDTCLCTHRNGIVRLGMAAVRNALGLKTEIVGVVSSECPAYALSFRQRKPVEAPARSARRGWPGLPPA